MMTGIRDRAGLTVLDERGVIVAITTDERDAGIFTTDGDAWLALRGMRRVGVWIAHRDPGRLASDPADRSICDVERIERPS
jgi:hypothetical protein